MPGKRSPRHLDSSTARTLLVDAFERAAQDGQIRRLLEGLLTRSEHIAIAQRLRIAQLLISGWSFRLIVNTTGASTSTIVGVDRWLRKENPRYRPAQTVRLHAGERSQSRNRPIPDTGRLSLSPLKSLERVIRSAGME